MVTPPRDETSDEKEVRRELEKKERIRLEEERATGEREMRARHLEETIIELETELGKVSKSLQRERAEHASTTRRLEGSLADVSQLERTVAQLEMDRERDQEKAGIESHLRTLEAEQARKGQGSGYVPKVLDSTWPWLGLTSSPPMPKPSSDPDATPNPR